MEPSGSLFPSLVVVGHVVTLAAVWRWRRGRWQVQDEQGKRRWRLPLGPLSPATVLSEGAGGGAGVRGRLPAIPAFPCPLLFLSLS